MSVWLYDIIKSYKESFSLKDNQQYCVENAKFRNLSKPTSETVFLNTKAKRNHLNNDQIFTFLKNIEKNVNEQIENSNIILFNEKEYENNADQRFIKLLGSRWDNFSLETGNIIGHLSCNEHHINIGSRFGDEFLKYIIADADGFLEIDNLGTINKQGNNHWLLQYYWVIKLKKAFRLGLPKVYEKQTTISSIVKGNIDVAYFELNKTIAKYKSTSRNHSFFCNQNLLILEAFKKVNKDFLSKDLFAIKQAFSVAGKGEKRNNKELLTVKNFSNPFYSDYNEVLSISKMLLENGAIDIGINSPMSGFLFDVSMLFEYFIRKLFKRNGFEIHSKNEHICKIPTGTNYTRSLFPDLIVTVEDKTFLLDVKYKSFDNRYGVKREDLFQLYTYLGQIGNDIEVDFIGFVYPTNDKMREGLVKESVTVLGKKISFIVTFLYVPTSSKNFNLDFTDSITNFMTEFKNLKNN